VLRNEAVRLFRDGLVRCRRRGHVAAVQLNAGVRRRIYGWRERLFPVIIKPSLGFLGVLSLLPFFQHFRSDSPYHLAGVAALQEAMPSSLLQEDSEWFEAWRAAGIDQEVFVPYFRQLDNGPDGWRDCFASSAAMLAASAGLVHSDNEYIYHLARFGDTTSVNAQLRTLRFLGLDAVFTQEGTPEMIEKAISRGSAVLVGWYHEGDLTRGEPPMCSGTTCGHWSVITGFQGKHSPVGDQYYVMHDPMGFPLIEKGGHDRSRSGKSVQIRQSEFNHRWLIEGEASGWMIFIDG
jgi:hypothetical protein